jgi:GST-like protein
MKTTRNALQKHGSRQEGLRKMIDFYGTHSPSVLKVAIMLEEIGLAYKGHHVGVLQGANYDPTFLALNPLAKVPVIVDHDGAGKDHPIFESGAILIYLAETYGSPLLPAAGGARSDVLKWLMVQVGYVGPMLGQLNHFQMLPSQADSYAFTRYRDQAAHVYGYVNDRLGVAPWLGGESYSIADIAMYPWTALLIRHGFDPADYPNLLSWREQIDARPAVKRAVAAIAAMAAADPVSTKPLTDADFDRFFGRSQPGPSVDFARYLALGPTITAKI